MSERLSSRLAGLAELTILELRMTQSMLRKLEGFASPKRRGATTGSRAFPENGH